VYIVLDTNIWISFLMGQTFDEKAGGAGPKANSLTFQSFSSLSS